MNVPGSYECVCPRGFSQLGHRCLDIDECVEQQVSKNKDKLTKKDYLDKEILILNVE